jgi:hypothetical protein
MSLMSETEATPTAPQPLRSVWDRVLTTTPVVLTVLATLLAGLSSSEMTQAQYYRSLAAQSQSKAADQWGFFQAKRMRGTSLEAALDLLPALVRHGKREAAVLLAASSRLVRSLQRGDRSARELSGVAGSGKGELPGPAGAALAQAVSELRKAAEDGAREAEKTRQALARELATQDAQGLLASLNADRRPSLRISPIEDPTVQQALEQVLAGTEESEMAGLVRQIRPDALTQAVHAAEADARAFDQANQPAADALDRIERLSSQQLALARPFHQAVREVDAALAELPAAERSAPGLQEAVADLNRADAAVTTAAGELSAESKALQMLFNARRYRTEARYNQRIAELYEVQVRYNSIISERHRDRSRRFFYGMLCAQAGVTVASLALAAQRMSVLWALAGLAGLIALGFSVFVYLYV